MEKEIQNVIGATVKGPSHVQNQLALWAFSKFGLAQQQVSNYIVGCGLSPGFAKKSPGNCTWYYYFRPLGFNSSQTTTGGLYQAISNELTSE
ncbi:hypothetical protein SESBI_45083 [Sesbania bispinosa]|nr:hypothetical protein SESBI_45083 [Sesbania bispinosa]